MQDDGEQNEAETEIHQGQRKQNQNQRLAVLFCLVVFVCPLSLLLSNYLASSQFFSTCSFSISLYLLPLPLRSLSLSSATPTLTLLQLFPRLLRRVLLAPLYYPKLGLVSALSPPYLLQLTPLHLSSVPSYAYFYVYVVSSRFLQCAHHLISCLIFSFLSHCLPLSLFVLSLRSIHYASTCTTLSLSLFSLF